MAGREEGEGFPSEGGGPNHTTQAQLCNVLTLPQNQQLVSNSTQLGLGQSRAERKRPSGTPETSAEGGSAQGRGWHSDLPCPCSQAWGVKLQAPQAGSGHPAPSRRLLLHNKKELQNPTFLHLLEALQNQLFTDALQINSAPVPVNLRTEGKSFTT